MSGKVHRIRLGLFFQAYLIETPDGLFLVDCGMPGHAKAILRRMQRLGRRDLKLIFITHAHIDHAGSAAALKQLTGAQLAVHRLDAEALRSAKMPAHGRSWTVRLVLAVTRRLARPQPVQPDILLEDGDSLERYGLPGKVVHTPGHSPGSCCLVLDDRRGFVGDLASTRWTRHLQFYVIEDVEQLNASFLRLRQLGLERVYVGHGRCSLSGAELAALIDARLPDLTGFKNL